LRLDKHWSKGPKKNRRARQCSPVKNNHNAIHSVVTLVHDFGVRHKRKTMALSAAARRKKLAGLVNEVIETDIAHERNGVLFAALPLASYANELKCSVKTISRDFEQPQFHRELAQINLKQAVLVRVLAPGEKVTLTPATVANQMRKVWENREIDHAAEAKAKAKAEAAGKPWKPWNTAGMIENGKPIMSKWQHRALIRLATLWPAGLQLAIFKCVMGNWKGFAVRAKTAMTAAQDLKTGFPLKTEETNWKVDGLKFYMFPTLELMLRYPDAAVELYEETLQAADNPDKSTFAKGLTW
jgi:hypothetical protein